MIEPWDRAHGNARPFRTLGLKIGGRNGESNSAIGWALIEHWKPAKATHGRGHQAVDDPIEAALIRAREAVLNGAEGVDLYRYADEEAFRRSRAATEGMTRKAHGKMVADLRRRLMKEGIDVTVRTVK